MEDFGVRAWGLGLVGLTGTKPMFFRGLNKKEKGFGAHYTIIIIRTPPQKKNSVGNYLGSYIMPPQPDTDVLACQTAEAHTCMTTQGRYPFKGWLSEW